MVEIKDHLNHGVIIYRLLWALFEPGKLVVTTQDGHTRFYLVKSCVYTEENGMVVSVRFIDWDLDQFGYADGILNICPFAGTTEAAAIDRGLKFQNLRGFHYMAYTGGFKNLILSFVEGQVSNKTAFDDLIEGKGLGIIMLLVGNPGTGKTLTAEAVADEVRKPLYILSAVELGNDATAVEDRLTKVLELTEKWDAVLLFDECDVFIQERSKEHLEHNKIVAVFLRLLEYYRGILFMTSNRAETIDRAFYSRIHLTLHYPDLEPAARDQIWRQFSQRSQMENKLADENFRNLAHLPMNGRQIKNVLKIAMLLARQEDTALSMDQIRTVLRATKEIGDGYEV
ncbi:ATPase [Colletotrichum graminicola]|nr:ATPase [Colletotrichum graminicola]